LDRANKLINGLQGEKKRWTSTVLSLSDKYERLIGDCLIAAGMVAYSGPFTADFRAEMEQSWAKKIRELKIRCSDDEISMRKILGDDVKIRQWNVANLPSDNLSIENAIILFTARKWALMIDPQKQANSFIKNMGKSQEQSMDIFKATDNPIIKQLETAIDIGKWVLLENVGEKIDPTLEPIFGLFRLDQGEQAPKNAKFGDKEARYSHTFSFFMTTTLPNPHYPPEFLNYPTRIRGANAK
jgi:dynein heavy chain